MVSEAQQADPKRTPKKSQVQLALDGFEGLGLQVDELPAGAQELTGKELRFVNALLSHGQMARAAVEAGFSAQSAGSIASETLRKPKVFGFYKRCLERVSGKSQQLVMRVWERSVLLHEKAKECAQRVKDFENMIQCAQKNGDNLAEAAEQAWIEQAKQLKLEKHYMGLANQTDTLLGSLLGKLNINLSVDGEVKHVHVSAQDLAALQESRLEYERGVRHGGN